MGLRPAVKGRMPLGGAAFLGSWIFGNDGGSLLILAENYNRPATGTTKTQSAQRTHKDVQRAILGPSPADRSLRGCGPAAPGCLHAASSPRVHGSRSWPPPVGRAVRAISSSSGRALVRLSHGRAGTCVDWRHGGPGMYNYDVVDKSHRISCTNHLRTLED